MYCLYFMMILVLDVMVTMKLLESSITGWEQLCDLIHSKRRLFTKQYSWHLTQPAPLPYMTAKIREELLSINQKQKHEIFLWPGGHLHSFKIRDPSDTQFSLKNFIPAWGTILEAGIGKSTAEHKQYMMTNNDQRGRGSTVHNSNNTHIHTEETLTHTHTHTHTRIHSHNQQQLSVSQTIRCPAVMMNSLKI